ncbi:MAG: iron ABC transporter permease [Gammaproteobacteria bacterium]|nr:iron ABC transporter permease [Gammaproteobacteria bacterium]MCP5424643.1 iron ABC transporter permease [Gammaproteobacteria bacterium]
MSESGQIGDGETALTSREVRAIVASRSNPQRRAFQRWYLDPWALGAILVALLVALPSGAVMLLAIFPSENIWGHLSATVLPGYIRTTLGLMLGVGLGTLFIGVSTAWLVTMCRFPGRRLFEWALLLPFAVPAYVIAYVYTDLLEYAGPMQGALRDLFGWNSAADYWFPEIRSLGGAISMMSLVMYPYVYLLARTAFLEQSPHLLDVSRMLGQGPWRSFFRLSLPIARPSIAVGVAVVLMETLNDFGTVDYFAVRTLTAGLYDVWLGMGNLGGAAQIACVMLLFVVVLITLERLGRRRQRHFQSGRRYQELPGYDLRGWRAGAATMSCLLPLVAGFVVPATVLTHYALNNLTTPWDAEFEIYARNSLLLSASAALLAVLIGIFLAYSRRLHKRAVLLAAVRLASLGYALPGAVLAIGVIIPFAAFDNRVDAWMREHFDVSTGLLLSGTVFAVIFAYVVRFLALSLGAIQASLSKVTSNMDMAARALGHGPASTLARVHLPLIRGGVLTAALVVFVDCMKELPATLILRPFNFDTLATYVFQFASDELLAECALAALLIVASGLIPVFLLSRTLSRTRRIVIEPD